MRIFLLSIATLLSLSFSAEAANVFVRNDSTYAIAVRCNVSAFSPSNWRLIQPGNTELIETGEGHDQPSFIMYRLNWEAAKGNAAYLMQRASEAQNFFGSEEPVAESAPKEGGGSWIDWGKKVFKGIQWSWQAYQTIKGGLPIIRLTVDTTKFESLQAPMITIRNYANHEATIEAQVVSLNVNEHLLQLMDEASQLLNDLPEFAEEFRQTISTGDEVAVVGKLQKFVKKLSAEKKLRQPALPLLEPSSADPAPIDNNNQNIER